MATVISRLFANEEAATAVRKRLQMKGFPNYVVRVVTSSMASPAQTLARDGVADKTAAAYVKAIADGGAALVIRATYKPLGAVRIARETLEGVDAVDMGKLPEENVVKDGPDRAPRVLKGHPHFLTIRKAPGDREPALVSRSLGLRLLSEHRTERSVMHEPKRMSRYFWPTPLLSKKQRTNTVMKERSHMSRLFWPMPLLLNTKRRNSVIRDGDTLFSQIFGFPTLTK